MMGASHLVLVLRGRGGGGVGKRPGGFPGGGVKMGKLEAGDEKRSHGTAATATFWHAAKKGNGTAATATFTPLSFLAVSPQRG